MGCALLRWMDGWGSWIFFLSFSVGGVKGDGGMGGFKGGGLVFFLRDKGEWFFISCCCFSFFFFFFFLRGEREMGWGIFNLFFSSSLD